MDLKDIAAVSGKSGLFKVFKPTRTGVILEALDEKKSKLIAGPTQRVSMLKEISIYTTGKESSVSLEDVFTRIHSKSGKSIKVNGKSSPEDLHGFLKEILPDYDQEKVYTSDIKKLVSWYEILSNYSPEIFESEKKKESPAKEEKEEKKEKVAETKAEKPAAKAKSKTK